jgi:hypothetical protein
MNLLKSISEAEVFDNCHLQNFYAQNLNKRKMFVSSVITICVRNVFLTW